MRTKSKLFLSTLLFVISVHSLAQSFIVTNHYIETKDYYEVCQDKCPEIEYHLINSSVDWLDSIINKAVVDNLKINNDDKSIEQRWKTFDNITTPNQAQFANQLNFAIADFVKANKQFHKETTRETNYSVTSTPNYLGHKTLKNGRELELFSVDGDQYLGGAHGVSWSKYYVFDMASKRQLKLDDIVLPNQKVKLEKLVKTEYEKYLKTNNLDPKEMTQTWKFFLTDNFSFTDKGVTFQYQHYDITPYVMGMPEFTIPYSQLDGVIKAEYLN